MPHPDSEEALELETITLFSEEQGGLIKLVARDLSQVYIKPMPTGIWLSGDV